MIKKIIQYLLQNISEEQKIVKNSFWISLARFGGSVFRAILVIISFRILGPSLQGSFYLAMNFILIFSFIPDFGLTAVVIRELSKNYENRRKIFSNAVFAVLFLLIISLVLINLTKFIFIKDTLAKGLIILLSIFLIFDTLREFLYSIFRAKEKMEMQALSHLTTNFLLLCMGLIFLKLNPDPFSLAKAYLLASIIGFLITFFMIKKEFFFNYFKFLEKKLTLDLLNKSWPIGIANFLFLIITYLDTVILGWFQSSKDVGLYNSIVKLSEFLYFFPAALAMSIFPILSKKNTDEFDKTINFGFQLALFMSLPILIILFSLSPEIIKFIFGDKYIEASLGLKFISFAIPFNFMVLILIDALIAIDKRKELLIYEILIVSINFILNILFVPYYSYFASSLITSLCSILSLIFSYFILKKHISFSFKIKKFLNYPLAAILSLFPVAFINVHLILKIIIYCIFYVSLLLIIKDSLFIKIKNYNQENL
jgi:O-antigen/teichoic acid export membrane protein